MSRPVWRDRRRPPVARRRRRAWRHGRRWRRQSAGDGMPLSASGGGHAARRGPGCPGAGAPPVGPALDSRRCWPGGVMPLSSWVAGCAGAGAPPVLASVPGRRQFWFGGVMPLSKLDPDRRRCRCAAGLAGRRAPGALAWRRHAAFHLGSRLLWRRRACRRSECRRRAASRHCLLRHDADGAPQPNHRHDADHRPQHAIPSAETQNPPPPARTPIPELRSRQVTRPFTNSTIRRWTRSFQVAKTINVSTKASPMRKPYS